MDHLHENPCALSCGAPTLPRGRDLLVRCRRRWPSFALALALASVSVACSAHPKDQAATTPTPTAASSSLPSGGGQTPGTGTATPSVGAPPLTSKRAAQIHDELISGSDKDVRAAVAVPSGVTISATTRRQLRKMTDLHIDVSTFKDTGGGTAVVKALLDGDRWTLYLVAEDHSWKISATAKDKP